MTFKELVQAAWTDHLEAAKAGGKAEFTVLVSSPAGVRAYSTRPNSELCEDIHAWAKLVGPPKNA